MKYGDIISKLRESQNLTQEELAKRLGISRAALSHYEKNRREPDYDTLQKIADYFEVTVDYLLGRTQKEKLLKESGIEYKTYLDLSSYQKEVVDFILSRENLFFEDKPEDILEALEQFEIYYELYKKQQAKKENK